MPDPWSGPRCSKALYLSLCTRAAICLESNMQYCMCSFMRAGAEACMLLMPLCLKAFS